MSKRIQVPMTDWIAYNFIRDKAWSESLSLPYSEQSAYRWAAECEAKRLYPQCEAKRHQDDDDLSHMEQMEADRLDRAGVNW